MEKVAYKLLRPVFFVGFMGAGKTTLTRRMARNLGLTSVDIDRCIEREQGCTIKELFSRVSEPEFREMEARMLEHFASLEPSFISCGGGLVEGERSREILRTKGFCVHMYVSADESASRISNHATRPFFETMESVRAVNARRAPLYDEVADRRVDTTGQNPYSMEARVLAVLLEEGVLVRLDEDKEP